MFKLRRDYMSNSEQFSLFDGETKNNGPIVCLGMKFESEDSRREYFCEELRKKLPELKEIEGFPIGEDEDIIALSDPPYYTACPNPWINDFIDEWEKEKVTKYGRDVSEEYHREPFASDVSEGKNDPIYNAHSYHTKVPHKAIINYLLHYTKPGDIVYDGFCGTGMTGVAAYEIGNRDALVEMGLIVEKDGSVKNFSGENLGEIGKRYAVLNDLSPAASSIATNYVSPHFAEEFKVIASRILKEAEQLYGWMYETDHEIKQCDLITDKDQIIKGIINYSVWSDVFSCNSCSHEIVYFDEAIDLEKNAFREEISCPNCNKTLKKSELNKVWISNFDPLRKEVVNQVKQVPVLINYSVGSKRFEKKPSQKDLDTIKNIMELELDTWVPTKELPEGQNTAQPKNSHGFTYIHDLYSKRNLIILSYVNSQISNYSNRLLKSWLTSAMTRTTKMYKFTLDRKMGTVSGTYYIPSLWTENTPFKLLKRKINDFSKLRLNLTYSTVVNCGTQTNLSLKENSVDYIFTDPPFGGNLMYSELNFLWEAWSNVVTNNQEEAIVNKFQRKTLLDYQKLMEKSFREYYKVLKSGRWITVEFSNSKASVWNSIQEAMQKAGFVIANVSALDKKQGSFKAVTSTTAVKQDLVISAYKPSKENINKMNSESNTPASAWTFISQHLEKLPVFLGSKGEASIISERTPRILFDRMVAYHVQNSLPVPISSAEFQEGVAQRFPMRDGMAFLESQVAEYDKKRTLVKEFSQMSLFVSDENSAIEWIRQQLLKKPQTRQDLHPQFMKEIQHIAKHEQLPELDSLLVQNFLRYDGGEVVPNQIATYLRSNYHDMRGLESDDVKLQDKAMNRWYVPDPNKQADLEKLREKALLREFESCVEELGSHKKKLKVFRTEAIRAGFKKAWSEKDYAKIVTVGDRLPESVIQEDDKLLMYYDNAQIRLDM